MDRRQIPIVVGGCHRSGTSLIRRILDSHSRIHCGPEVPFFRDFYGDYRQDPLRHLRFARAAQSMLSEEELLQVLGGGFLELHERSAAKASKPRWADKAPENVLYTDAWDTIQGRDWVLMHVVRNPLDTLASMHDHPFPLTLPGDLADRASVWNHYTESGLRFAARDPDRYRRVVYEELARAPGAVVGSLMEWLGEALEPGQLRFNAAPHERGLEDPKITATTSVHGKSIGRWREILTDREAALVWRMTEPTWLRIDPGCVLVDSPPA
jgi:hypothetical protein